MQKEFIFAFERIGSRILELSKIRHDQDQKLSRMGLMYGGIEEEDDELSEEGN